MLKKLPNSPLAALIGLIGSILGILGFWFAIMNSQNSDSIQIDNPKTVHIDNPESVFIEKNNPDFRQSPPQEPQVVNHFILDVNHLQVEKVKEDIGFERGIACVSINTLSSRNPRGMYYVEDKILYNCLYNMGYIDLVEIENIPGKYDARVLTELLPYISYYSDYGDIDIAIGEVDVIIGDIPQPVPNNKSTLITEVPIEYIIHFNKAGKCLAGYHLKSQYQGKRGIFPEEHYTTVTARYEIKNGDWECVNLLDVMGNTRKNYTSKKSKLWFYLKPIDGREQEPFYHPHGITLPLQKRAKKDWFIGTWHHRDPDMITIKKWRGRYEISSYSTEYPSMEPTTSYANFKNGQLVMEGSDSISIKIEDYLTLKWIYPKTDTLRKYSFYHFKPYLQRQKLNPEYP